MKLNEKWSDSYWLDMCYIKSLVDTLLRSDVQWWGMTRVVTDKKPQDLGIKMNEDVNLFHTNKHSRTISQNFIGDCSANDGFVYDRPVQATCLLVQCHRLIIIR